MKIKAVTLYAMKAYGETRDIAPLTPYLRTDWWRVVFILLKGIVLNITLRLRNERKADSLENTRNNKRSSFAENKIRRHYCY